MNEEQIRLLIEVINRTNKENAVKITDKLIERINKVKLGGVDDSTIVEHYNIDADSLIENLKLLG